MPPPNESSFWWLALTAISSSGIAILAVAWLIKTLLSQWLSKEQAEHSATLGKESETFKADLEKGLEAYRVQLKQEKDLEMEKLRTEMNRLTMEHQVRFNQLHTKRFVTIARLYRLIVGTQLAMSRYFAPYVPAGAGTEAERGKTAGEKWAVLNGFFREHEIYFDKATCEMIRKYINGLYELTVDFSQRDQAKGRVEEWKKVWDKLNTEVIPIKISLADTFRKEIGVKTE